MPAMTSRIDGAVLSRRATTATTTRTARRNRRVSMVAVMGAQTASYGALLRTPRARLFLFDNAQPAHRQLVNLQRAETRLLDREATDGEAADGRALPPQSHRRLPRQAQAPGDWLREQRWIGSLVRAAFATSIGFGEA